MSVWSSRVRLADTGPRCKIVIAKMGFACNRPAFRYSQTVEKHGELYNLGIIECCVNHRKMHEKQGITMTRVYVRKRKSKEAVMPPDQEKQ